MSEYDPVAFDAFEAEGWGIKEAAGYDTLAGRVTSRLADPLLDVVGQSADMQRAIRTHFDELLEEYRTEDGFDVPVSVKLASGRKASQR